MTSAQVLFVLTRALVVYAILGAGYTILAWYLVRRVGPRSLSLLWGAGALAIAAIGTIRVHRQASALGLPPSPGSDLRVFFGFLALGLVACGLASLGIRKRIARGMPEALTIGAVLLGAATFLGGIVLCFIPFLLWRLWHR
ncbi:MAG: hypothetical protein ACREMO_07685 [Gemmatimonadales bacterium]